MVNSTWYQNSRQIASRGSQAKRPGSLAGLAAARRKHMGQFFTPDAIAALMWEIASPAMQSAIARDSGSKVALIDTSIGSGRLMQFASPDQHSIAGCDVDDDCLSTFASEVEAAGFDCDILCTGLESIKPKGFGAALLNPPFSLHLDAPTICPLPGTTYGKYGPNSATVSHRYAVEQALSGAEIVLAILPKGSHLHWAGQNRRLRAIIRLPAGTFKDEKTQVETELLVFSKEEGGEPQYHTVDTLPALNCNPFALVCSNTYERRARPLSASIESASAPVIMLPVTGDSRVTLHHSGRKIVLGFHCGLTQAKVMNGLLKRRVKAPSDEHRYPQGVRFVGQGRFDIENYLLADDPSAALRDLLEAIRLSGGKPVVPTGFSRYFENRIRRHLRETTPYRHVVPAGAVVECPAGGFEAVAKRKRLVHPLKLGSGLILPGMSFTFSYADGCFITTHPDTGETLEVEMDAFNMDFERVNANAPATGWQVVHEGRVAAFPQLAKTHMAAICQAGIDVWLDRDYQVHDLIEMRMGRGGTLAWEMALGKTRCALALAMLGGRHNLIVLEPQLIEECIKEIKAVGLADDEWQVIRTPQACHALRRINIISYNRLRMEIKPGAGRRTYARMLRKRIATLVADEGDVLTNHTSKQSQALQLLCAKRKYLLTGTPARNMPRDILGVATYTGGDGTALQPFGRHHPYASADNVSNMDHAITGAVAFSKRHAVFQWVTHEFLDTGLVRGAKREIPKARNIETLRDYAAPLLKRRTQKEPEVSKYLNIPEATISTTVLKWDEQHLRHYLSIADEFASYYRRAKAEATGQGKGLNLITLLARIGAVERACTCPQFPTPGFPYKGGLTSKQRYLIERMEALTHQGRKTICFVEQPKMVMLLVNVLAKRGIEAVPFHGGIPIAQRIRQLDTRFREGDAPVLIATKECAQAGYNIPQANYVLFADRNWVSRVEKQALYRVLRGEQTQHVEAEFVHLEGSIDEYMGQVVDMKADTIGACIDFLTPELQGLEFKHIDAILDNFIEKLAAREGFKHGFEFRRLIKDAP